MVFVSGGVILGLCFELWEVVLKPKVVTLEEFWSHWVTRGRSRGTLGGALGPTWRPKAVEGSNM